MGVFSDVFLSRAIFINSRLQTGLAAVIRDIKAGARRIARHEFFMSGVSAGRDEHSRRDNVRTGRFWPFQPTAINCFGQFF